MTDFRSGALVVGISAAHLLCMRAPAGAMGRAAVNSAEPVLEHAGSPSPGLERGAPGWERGSFAASDGAGIEYFHRKGFGPAVLLLHGRAIGGAGFSGWRNAFPRRPMLVLNRRGYGGSERGTLDEDNLRELNSQDVLAAISLARSLRGGEKAGVVCVSLGAMLLPAMDPESVLWLALVNPGVFGMLERMDPLSASFAQGLKSGWELSRFWLPPFRAGWLSQAAGTILEDLVSRIKKQADTEHSRSLARELRQWASDPGAQELLVQETLWALFGRKPDKAWGPVPVFLGMSQDDEVVPQEAYQELIKELEGRAASLQTARWPGGHLLPLLAPEKAIQDIEGFDAQVRGGRR